jgi:uncharacterized delta-60 repeat protein
MRPFHIHLGSGGLIRQTRSGRSARPPRAVLRLLCVAWLLAWLLAVAAPAHASPGDLDPSFGTGGKVITTEVPGPAFALVVQADGKLVAAWPAPGTGFGDFGLVRYSPDGTLDPSFGTAGIVTTSFGIGGARPFALVVQADGKLVAAGAAFDTTGLDFALARYNPDGTLDPSFGTGGLVTTDFAATNDQAVGLIVQADGKLVAAGSTDVIPGGSDLALARYNPDGTLDPSFGTGGKVTTDFAGDVDVASALAAQADGRLVVAGVSNTPGVANADFALVRYRSNGKLDRSFGGDGKVTTDVASSNERALALAVQADGRLVAAGVTGSPGSSETGADFALVRYRSNGNLDRNFGTGGKVTTDFTGRDGFDQANALVLQVDGKLVAAGFAAGPPGSDFGLARYNPDGSLDPSFGTAGRVTTDFTGTDEAANALAVQADGKLVAAGYTNSGAVFAMARYLAD